MQLRLCLRAWLWAGWIVLFWINHSSLSSRPPTILCRSTSRFWVSFGKSTVAWTGLSFLGHGAETASCKCPGFLKVADAAGIPEQRIILYGLDRSKITSDGLAEKYQIRLVPTFICLKEGGEIGRITETPPSAWRPTYSTSWPRHSDTYAAWYAMARRSSRRLLMGG